jgi:signal transduction histidine kinase/ActR/RegA family two-component response regulator
MTDRYHFIKSSLEKKNYTIKEFAKIVGLEATEFSEWMENKRELAAEKILPISKALDLSFFETIFAQKESIILKEQAQFKDQVDKNSQLSIVTAKINMISTVAASLAHEINNPLAIIRGNLEIIQKNDRSSKSSFSDIFDSVEHSINRLKNVVETLNLYASFSGSIQNFEHINANELIQETILQIIPKLQDAQIDLQTSYDKNEVLVMGNKVLFRQSMLSLLENAIEAMNTSPSKKLIIKTTMEDDQLILTIVDSGTGIHPDELDSILEPFYTSKEPGHGLGLGLTVASYIIKSMSGTLSIQNNPEATGIKLAISLPLLHASPLLATQKLNVDFSHKSFLVVDDEEDIRDIIIDYLEELSPQKIEQAQSGEDAWAKLLKLNFDYLITDIRMPGMTGVDLIKKVRSHPLLQNIQIIVITGSVGEYFTKGKSEIRGMVNSYLNKPFTESEVRNTIMEVAVKNNSKE